MIYNIKRFGSAAKTAAVELHLKKRAKELFTYASITTMGAYASWQLGKIVTLPVADEFISISRKAITPSSKILLNKKRAYKTAIPSNTSWNESLLKNDFFEQLAKKEALKKAERLKQAAFTKQKKAVLRIMEEDKACTLVDKEKIAKQIVTVANDYGASPIDIACIAKRETHFSQNQSSNKLKGMMQVTDICIKDMYQKGREVLYHQKLNDLKKVYKTPDELYKAIGSNSELNLRVGTILYLSLLKRAKGNVNTALRNYNGSYLKDNYAKDVAANIRRYMQEDCVSRLD